MKVEKEEKTEPSNNNTFKVQNKLETVALYATILLQLQKKKNLNAKKSVGKQEYLTFL